METSKANAASFIKAIIITAFIAGTLDMIGAIISYTAAGGKNPSVILQYIASAVFGKSVFNEGSGMMIVGGLLHYAIAFLFTLLFFLAFPKVKLLQGSTLFVAISYGVFVWFVMNVVVIPYFTKLDAVTFDLTKAAIAVSILIICIGLPVVIGAKRYYLKNI